MPGPYASSTSTTFVCDVCHGAKVLATPSDALETARRELAEARGLLKQWYEGFMKNSGYPFELVNESRAYLTGKAKE